MRPPIAEMYWKTLRDLHPIALDRYCAGVLDEVQGIIADRGPR